MSDKLRECRQGLAEALDQATKDVPELECHSPKISGPVIYVSSPLADEHLEMLSDRSLCLKSCNEMLIHATPQFLGLPDIDKTTFHCSRLKPELLQDLPGPLEASSAQALEELLAKLEFENELNRVCSGLKLSMSPPSPDRGHSTGSADSGIEEGTSERYAGCEEEEHLSLLDTVLEMEQDYDLY